MILMGLFIYQYHQEEAELYACFRIIIYLLLLSELEQIVLR